jgi:hypothetical protein
MNVDRNEMKKKLGLCYWLSRKAGDKMKQYEFTMRCTVDKVITVEADSEEEAKVKADHWDTNGKMVCRTGK